MNGVVKLSIKAKPSAPEVGRRNINRKEAGLTFGAD